MQFTPPEWTPGDRLRRQREDLDLTVEALAAAAGVNKETVVNAEKNRGTTDRTWERLATALQAPLGWLRDGDTA